MEVDVQLHVKVWRSMHKMTTVALRNEIQLTRKIKPKQDEEVSKYRKHRGEILKRCPKIRL